MNLAPLQLTDYFLTDLSLKANPSYEPQGPKGDGIDALQVTPSYTLSKDGGEKGTEWLVTLEISQTIPEGENLPYTFSLCIQGTILATPHLTGARLHRVIHANGPTMLFGAAREIIRAATGRGPWAAVIIPSTNFLAGLPPLESPPPTPLSQKNTATASTPAHKKTTKPKGKTK